uniref:Hemoglobin subunit beta-1 n=1 Tax=Torpedo marmorata TaxID=7788 RepID=HBB1_TORMA|nr:RecName: Full=Hemoglobin subunit beta-1; AltName: Full=Beta-1-globin; AltName: Full=Hemoglobin beta-1 chain [Torpedo marmorata]
VSLTDEEIRLIQHIWSNVNVVEITAKALERVFYVYPWTTRLFTSFNHNFKASDKQVHDHAVNVSNAISAAIGDLHDINKNFSALSTKHQKKLGVDTSNFMLLGQAFLVELAALEKDKFTPQYHKAALKLFEVVTEALSCQYH